MLTLNSIKGEGNVEDGYVMYTTSYIKEYPMVCIQTESWNEEDIKRDARDLYNLAIEDIIKNHPGDLKSTEPLRNVSSDVFEISWYDDFKKWLNDGKD